MVASWSTVKGPPQGDRGARDPAGGVGVSAQALPHALAQPGRHAVLDQGRGVPADAHQGLLDEAAQQFDEQERAPVGPAGEPAQGRVRWCADEVGHDLGDVVLGQRRERDAHRPGVGQRVPGGAQRLAG